MARKRVDDVAVTVPVLMIDAEARVVPPDEASTNDFGHCAAEIGLGGDADAVADLLLEDQGGFGRITRQFAFALQFVADPFGERKTAGFAAVSLWPMLMPDKGCFDDWRVCKSLCKAWLGSGALASAGHDGQ